MAELPAGCHGDSGRRGGACALEEEGTGPVSGDEERACVGGQPGVSLEQGERGSTGLERFPAAPTVVGRVVRDGGGRSCGRRYPGAARLG